MFVAQGLRVRQMYCTALKSQSLPQTDSVCEEINSFFLVVEDPDVPAPSPVIHGIYYDIPPSRLKVRKEDFVEVKKDDCGGSS
ncbi:uncharacterized protein EAF02_010336 [Botrytis sinoallii]|uniref:uncharacterized protein n=1 Tax=Botrytis sinoallii TaxID=1463999 RepID=UPI0018FF9BCC|nr:uncharacterized protein EAF02_010336 [Botrytis sinoallii]KAF7862787.1 hypothetical protein EAF02_010336 [Botrytis sinoallii]